jgi:hypothetical protein
LQVEKTPGLFNTRTKANQCAEHWDRYTASGNQHVRLRLSDNLPAVFFSQKKPASSTFSQPDQPKPTGSHLPKNKDTSPPQTKEI